MRVGICGAIMLAACVGDSSNTDAGADSGADVTVVDASTDAAKDAVADTAADVDDGGSSWTPAALGSAVVLWVDGDHVTTSNSKVAALNDQSASGNSAVQGAANLQPTLNASKLNTHATVHFTPCAYLSVADAASLQFGHNGFTIGMVAAFVNQPDAGAATHVADFFAKQAVASPYSGIILRGNDGTNNTDFSAYLESPALVTSANGMNTGTFHRVVLRRTTATSLELRVDGVSTTMTVPNTDTSAVGINVIIGGEPSAAECVDGDLAEMVVVNTGVSGNDLTSLEAYLKAKYAL